MREQCITLEHGIEGALVRRDARNILAFKQDPPLVGSNEACNLAEESRFTAARRPQKSYKLSPANIEINVVQHFYIPEGFAQVLNIDNIILCHPLTLENMQVNFNAGHGGKRSSIEIPP